MNVRIPIRGITLPLLLLLAAGTNPRARAQSHLPAVTHTAFLANTPSQVQSDGTVQNLHLLVGHSVFLKTTNPLRRIYVSNPQLLQSFISNPKEVVITAKAPGVGTLALWDNTGNSSLYTVSADLDITALRSSLQQALPGQDVQVQAREGKIYLSGSVPGDDSYKEAGRLASLYSQD